MRGFDWNNHLLEPAATGTDFLRLGAGELVYMGLLRTRLDAILPVARIGGRSLPQAPELFSIMADARLAMGQISPEGYFCDTADGARKDRQSALRRLACCVCADLDEVGEGAAMAISRQAAEHSLDKVAAAGTGEGLITEAAAFLGMECVGIWERYG